MLQCVAFKESCSVLRSCVAFVCCVRVLQWVACKESYNMLHSCVAVCCTGVGKGARAAVTRSILQCCCSMFERVAVYCSLLECDAVCWSVLQCAAVQLMWAQQN